MAIPVSIIKEGCCNSHLSSFTVIDGDALDQSGSTCDKIIECGNKYILVEEKSLLFGFFNLCCKEVGQELDNYKEDRSGIIHLKISEVIRLITTLDQEVKKRLFYQTVNELISSSLKKVSNTTHILATRYDSAKTNDMSVFYLYCHSGTPIDTIMAILVSSMSKKTPFIDCISLKNKLSQICS